MGETFDVDEGYWQALLQDTEANVPDEDAGRNGAADRAGSSVARPIDQLWEAARQACDCNEILEVHVTGFNRGGVLVDWDGLHGFVPASHILNMPNVTDDAQRRAEFEKRVGQIVKGKIIELDRAHGRFVLSERLAYNDRTRVELLLADLQPGQRRCGVVTTVCDFGAFIDLGGIEGWRTSARFHGAYQPSGRCAARRAECGGTGYDGQSRAAPCGIESEAAESRSVGDGAATISTATIGGRHGNHGG
jgi:predicted RNA-binding protein with RPS1 domain